jgi:hypothetical protein
MCGCIEQSETRGHYARALSPKIWEPDWLGGDPGPEYNLSPGRPALLLHMLTGKLQSDHLFGGYRTPNEAAAKRKPWINERIEKALTGVTFATCSGKDG